MQNVIQPGSDGIQERSNVHEPPINRLASELIAEIFMYSLPTYGEDDKKPCSFKISDAPLVLGRVCSLWREIAYSMPFLWSTICFSIPPENADKEARQKTFKALENFLCLSKSYPLCISLKGQVSKPEDVLKVLDILIPSFERWRRIHIRDVRISQSAFRTFLQIISMGTPILESIDMDYVSFIMDEDDDARIALDLSASRRLTELNLCETVLGSLNFTSPPENLSRMTIQGFIAPETFSALFAQLPSLTYLEASVSGSFPEEEFNSHRRIEHGLQTLVLIIAGNGPNGVRGESASLLQNLRLPFLQDLRVDYDPPSTVTFRPLKLLTRSGCNLKRLSLLTPYEEFSFERDILPLLKLSPALEQIEIEGALNETIFKGFTLDPESEDITCLNLKKLKFVILQEENIPYESLDAMIRSRGNPSHELKQVLLNRGIAFADNYRASIILCGYIHKLVDYPDVVQSLRDSNVQCCWRWYDDPLPIDEHLESKRWITADN